MSVLLTTSAANRKRLLIVRPDGIGDLVIFTSVLEGYARLYEGWEIDILCHPSARDLLLPIPLVNKIICFDLRELFLGRQILIRLFAYCWARSARYDVVVLPVYSRTVAMDRLVQWIKSPVKIAFDGDEANDARQERFLYNTNYSRIITGEKIVMSEIERNIAFLQAIGGDPGVNALRTRLWLKDEDRAAAERALQQHGLNGRKYICVFPGAGFASKLWGAAPWADLLRQIVTAFPDLAIVILGGQEDKETIAPIRGKIGSFDGFVDLSGLLPLRSMARVIESSKLLVSMDTSAVHIAAAVGTPNVCIMGGGHFGRFYPYGDLSKNRIVCRKMECFGCNWQCRFDRVRCIQEIPVNDVMAEVSALLRQG